MDTDKLRYFVVIAESGSLTKAATILGISHSGLSKAMSSLESEANLTLFRAQGRGLEITQEGKWFYGKAQEILRIVDEVSRGQQAERDLIRIGLSGVLAMTCAGALSQELGLPLQINEIDIGEVEGQVISGELDFGVAFIPSPKPELEYLEIGEVKFVSHAREDLLERTSAEDLPYVVPISEFPMNPLGFRSRDGWPSDIPRRPWIAVSGFAIALDLLRSGQGGLYMPEYVARLENMNRPTGLRIVAVTDHKRAETKRKLFIVKRQADAESREMKKAAKVIRRICCSKN